VNSPVVPPGTNPVTKLEGSYINVHESITMYPGIDHAVDVLFETSFVHLGAIVRERRDQSNEYALQLLRCHCDRGDAESRVCVEAAK
jgi:hypothetical protein